MIRNATAEYHAERKILINFFPRIKTLTTAVKPVRYSENSFVSISSYQRKRNLAQKFEINRKLSHIGKRTF